MSGEGPRSNLALPRIASLAVAAASVSFALLLPAAAVQGATSEKKNSCEECHSNPDFLVTNKNLYDYYQEWSRSIHAQEGVDCDDCHGGNPNSMDKKVAHGEGVKGSDPSSGVYYKNIPSTCGTCHEEIYEGFISSNHYKHLVKKKNEDQGPTCVTCHGAIDSEILNVTTVRTACARCHNEKTENHPENPAKAEEILNRFLSIHRFYRYIAIRAKPEEAQEFFEFIDPRMQQLSVTWHTFDLDKIDKGTAEVLMMLKMKRDEIRGRRAAAKEK